MPLALNKDKEFNIGNNIKDQAINDEVDFYIKHVLKHDNLELMFMKSFIYIENLLLKINQNLFSITNEPGFFILYGNYKKIRGVNNKFFPQIEFIKDIRDKIAHEIEYNIDTDINFITEFGLEGLSVIQKQMRITDYFSNIIFGILEVKIGMDLFDDFIVYKKDLPPKNFQ